MAVTTQNVIDRMGADKASIYADTTGQTTEEVVAQCLNSAKLYIKAFCIKSDQTYDESDEMQAEAITLYAIGEVYDFSNADVTGQDEKDQAMSLLENYFQQFKEDDSKPDLKPYAKATQSTGARYLDDIVTF